MNETLTINSSDEELLEAFGTHRRNANGETVGRDGDTLEEAVAHEGWAFIRMLTDGTTGWGEACLAEDGADRLWVVCDIYGPWAILVADAQETV
jgi:hypothetical protein